MDARLSDMACLPPLVDAFGRRHTYLRLAVTDRCNLRCLYCMPPEGVMLQPRAEILRFDEIVRLVRLLARMGVNKVRLTGGEPLIRRDVGLLIAGLARIDGIQTLAMTTNGVLLRTHAPLLREAGLTRLNVSLDTLRPDRFERITRRAHLSDVLGGIDAALAAGFAPLKINMVVMGGQNDDELADFVELAREKPIHVRFIEYMPFPGNSWRQATLVSYEQMLAVLRTRYPLTPAFPLGGSQVAREFEIPGFRGRVGFITPMTAHFCDSCSRLRITADGQLRTCLFNTPQGSLRDALRGGARDSEIEAKIRAAVACKPARHHAYAERADRCMAQIGG